MYIIYEMEIMESVMIEEEALPERSTAKLNSKLAIITGKAGKKAVKLSERTLASEAIISAEEAQNTEMESTYCAIGALSSAKEAQNIETAKKGEAKR
jgi:hypothetical protein